MGHEDEELKPYIEPEADLSDSARIGMSDSVGVCVYVNLHSMKYTLTLFCVDFVLCQSSW